MGQAAAAAAVWSYGMKRGATPMSPLATVMLRGPTVYVHSTTSVMIMYMIVY